MKFELCLRLKLNGLVNNGRIPHQFSMPHPVVIDVVASVQCFWIWST
ncbi:MAG: hypothetical protein AAF490_26130 [Chloroflexota bacterium]